MYLLIPPMDEYLGGLNLFLSYIINIHVYICPDV